jgi:hypothetical protein
MKFLFLGSKGYVRLVAIEGVKIDYGDEEKD